MTYATSSPAATTGGQGNNPVSIFSLVHLYVLYICNFTALSVLRSLLLCLLRVGFIFSPNLLSAGLAAHCTRLLSSHPINNLSILSTLQSSFVHYQRLSSHAAPSSCLSPFLSPFLVYSLTILWRVPWLIRSDPNYSRYVRIAALPRLPYGVGTNSARCFATPVACF